MSDKVDFRGGNVTRNNESQEDITVLSIYVPNHRTSQNMKQKLIALKGEKDKFIIIVGEFQCPNWQNYQTENQYIELNDVTNRI